MDGSNQNDMKIIANIFKEIERINVDEATAVDNSFVNRRDC